MPGTTTLGLAALIPVNNRKISSAGKLGASAEAIVNIENSMNVEIMILCLPYVSDKGPKRRGPSTYPTKYMEMGRISAAEFVIWKYLLMSGMAFEGREEPIVLFTTMTIPTKTIKIFFLYDIQSERLWQSES